MPILPFPKVPDVGQLDPRSAGIPQSSRGPEAYGLPGAQALGQVGAAVQRIGEQFVSYGAEKQRIKDNFDVASEIANKPSFQKDYNDNVIGQTDASGAQLMPTTEEKWNTYHDARIKEFAAKNPSSIAMRNFELQLAQEKKQFMDNAAVTSSKMAVTDAARVVDTGIANILNNISTNGVTDQKGWEAEVKKGADLINASTQDPNTKAQSIKDLENKATIIRFETLLYPKAGGLKKEDVEAIQKELDMPYWRDKLATGDLDRIRIAIATSRAAFAELTAQQQTDPKINRVFGDPSTYEAELANLLGVDTKGLPGVKIAANKLNDVSAMTRVRFEALGEQAVTAGDEAMMTGKAKTRDESEIQINTLIKDLNTNPVWQERLTREAYFSLKNSLQTRKNALDADWNRLQSATATERNRIEDLAKADIAATGTDFKGRLEKGEVIPDGEYDAWVKARLELGDKNLTASQRYMVQRVEGFQVTFKGLGHNPTQADIDAAKRAVYGGGTGTGQKYSPAPRGGGSASSGGNWQVGLTPFNISRYGRAAINNLNPEFGQNLHSLITSAPPDIQREIKISSGWRSPDDPRIAARHRVNPKYVADPSSSYHGGHGQGRGGLAVDFQTSSNRAIAWLHQHAGEYGIVFPLDGSGNKPNEPWHAELAGARGGGGGGGGAVSGIDAWKRASAANETGNRANPYQVRSDIRTASGYDWGKYQVNERNIGPWTEKYFGKRLSVQEFVNSPEAQEKVYEGEFGRLVQKYGVRGAAAAWNAGEGGMNSPVAQAYAAKFMRNLGASGGDTGDGGGAGGDTSGGRAGLLTTNAPLSGPQSIALEALNAAQKNLSDGLKNNTIEFGAQQLHLAVVGLDPNSPESFSKRADLYGKIKDYYGLTADQQHPLTQTDVNTLSEQLNSNDSDKMNKVWANIARWSPEMQEAAWKQLELTTPFGAAAGRVYASGRQDIANLAIRGRAIQDSLKADGATPAWMEESNKWYAGLGPMLAGMTTPTKGAGIKQVIDAVHMARHPSDTFDAAQYQKDAEDVLGVKFDTVHGATVAIIPGTTGKQWEDALPALDLTAVSYTQTPALAVDPVKLITDPQHSLLPVNSVAVDNAIPIRMAEGLYAFMDTDENFFQTITHEKTADYPNGKPQIYLAQLTKQIIEDAAKQAHQEAVTPDQQSIMKTYETGMGAPAGPDTNLGVTPPPPGPTEPRVKATDQSVRSFTSMTEEAKGGPAPLVTGSAKVVVGAKTDVGGNQGEGVPAKPAAPKAITPTQEKDIQSAADDFIDILSRNASLDKQYLEVARKHFVDTQRAYYLGQPSQ